MVKGLRTQESKEFVKYIEAVQKEAEKQGCVFFLDCADGNDRIVERKSVCDLFGWLIPAEQEKEFSEIWENFEENDDWVD